MRTAVIGMIEQLTFLCVTSNQIDADVGEGGKEDKCEDGCHWDDCKLELPRKELIFKFTDSTLMMLAPLALVL